MTQLISTSEPSWAAFGSLRASGRRTQLLVLSLALCYAVYLLQMFSPLRMTTDSVEYLSVAASGADGNGFLLLGQPTQHPAGYAAMIAALDRVGIAGPWSLVGLNCAFLLIGVLASYLVARRAFLLSVDAAMLGSLLTLLSFLVVKHTPVVLSDIPFFGLSLASLSLLQRAELEDRGIRRQAAWLFLALMLLLAATLTRSIGITLLPAMGWVAGRITGLDKRLRRDKTLRFVLVLIIAASVAIGSLLFKRSMYGSMFSADYRHGIVGTWAATAVLRLRELGELTLNIPATKVPAVKYAAGMVGLLVIVLLAAGLYRRRSQLRAADIYLIACLGGLLLTPWSQDARYWIPVLPIIIAALMAEISSWWRQAATVRWAGYAICGLYGAMGIIALGYSTRVTFSGAAFPEIYGGGSFAPIYRIVLLHQPPLPNESFDPEALRVLQRYGGRKTEKLPDHP